MQRGKDFESLSRDWKHIDRWKGQLRGGELRRADKRKAGN